MAELPPACADGILMDPGELAPRSTTPRGAFPSGTTGRWTCAWTPLRASVADWLAEADVPQMAEVIRDYGEERFAQQIAKAIDRRRQERGPNHRRAGQKSWLARSKPARARTLQRGHFRLFGFSSTPSSRSSSRR